MLKPKITSIPDLKIMINIGACLDIPTGSFTLGKHGESILNGGLGPLTGITGAGNSFKSTLSHYMTLSAADRISSTTDTAILTYDTEVNIQKYQLQRFIDKFDYLKDKDILHDNTWNISDKTLYIGNKWYNEFKEYLKEKIDNKKKITVSTPFIDPSEIMTPTFAEVDSFTEFETSDIVDMQDKNELGDGGANTLHMKLGLAKTRMLMELPRISASGSSFVILTAHMGKESNIGASPYAAPPEKQLRFLKQGDKIKGVTSKFSFLMNNCWYVAKSDPFIDKNKEPQYPRSNKDNFGVDYDLFLVTMINVRSKSGMTGYNLGIVLSQSEGVLPTLTEFHNLMLNERFGISGNLQHYNLDIYPDVKLSRTTVRSKIDSDPKLRRAINITSEMLQIAYFHRNIDKNLFCTPTELYEDLKKLGYDWDVLLNTRGWWTVNDEKHPIPFLSTMDLLKMRIGTYKPYWMK